ncbi:MAG: hypothetical protein HY720_03735 [Planctomycetes bacterium]|nr:hypothetical protein [Planctomycetota bacterium]
MRIPTLLLACLVSGALHAQEDPKIVLRFAWPKEGTVQVSEKRAKRGGEAEMTYRLRISPEGEDGGIRVAYEEFAFVRVNGMDANRPELREVMARLRATEGLIPAYRVDREGEFCGIVDFDTWLESMVGTLEGLPSMSEDVKKKLREFFTSAQGRETLAGKAAEPWNAWAGHWTGLEIAVGEVQEFEVEQTVPLAGGEIAVPVIYRVSCEERMTDAGVECVRLRSVQEPDSEKLLEAAERFLREHPVDRPEAALANLSTTTVLEGVYEIAALRPHRASIRMTMRVAEEGGEEHEQVDLREYAFLWPDLAAAEEKDE